MFQLLGRSQYETYTEHTTTYHVSTHIHVYIYISYRDFTLLQDNVVHLHSCLYLYLHRTPHTHMCIFVCILFFFHQDICCSSVCCVMSVQINDKCTLSGCVMTCFLWQYDMLVDMVNIFVCCERV